MQLCKSVGEFAFALLKRCNLARQYVGPARHRLLFSGDLGGSLVHFGDAPLGFPSSLLPAANFCHRNRTPLALLGNLLVER